MGIHDEMTNSGNLDWVSRIRAELSQAEAARAAGNEGMARVCARRAAGIAAGEYLNQRNLPSSNQSAFERLKTLQSRTEISPRARDVIAHFLLRITPEHRLPIDADLIDEAKWLMKELVGHEV